MGRAITECNYSVYLHLYADGRIYLLPRWGEHGYIADLRDLERELHSAKRHGGRVLFSVEDNSLTTDDLVAKIVDLLSDYQVKVEIVDPHPQVGGYNKSYLPYLEEAAEMAELDVEGISRYIEWVKDSIAEAKPTSDIYQQREALLRKLKKRLERAKEAYQKLSELKLDLSVYDDQVQ